MWDLSSLTRDPTRVSCIGFLTTRPLGKSLCFSFECLQSSLWSLTLAEKIPRTEGPGGLQSMRLQKVGHSWAIEHVYVREINSIIFEQWAEVLPHGASLLFNEGVDVCKPAQVLGLIEGPWLFLCFKLDFGPPDETVLLIQIKKHVVGFQSVSLEETRRSSWPPHRLLQLRLFWSLFWLCCLPLGPFNSVFHYSHCI